MELLLELYGEEIPARLQKGSMDAFCTALCGALDACHVTYDAPKAWVGACRMGFAAFNLVQQPIPPVVKKGPLTSAPELAIAGFLRSCGISSVAQCTIEDSPKGSYYVYQGDTAVPDLKKSVRIALLMALEGMVFEKSMIWYAGQVRPWVRPLHSVLCLLDGAVLALDFLGIASGALTKGHKYLAPEPFSVNSFADYERKLTEASVLIHFDDRHTHLMEGCRALAESKGFHLHEDTALSGEIAGLVEYPFPILGKFSEVFLRLPQELLILVMKKHQRYIALLDADGTLVPYFLCVSNIPDLEGLICLGNERVLHARFADAQYLYAQDAGTGLIAKLDHLKDVMFFENAEFSRTLLEKAGGVSAIAEKLENLFPSALGEPTDTLYFTSDDAHTNRDKMNDMHSAVKAGLLCKADLVSATVIEFPELQGIIGGHLVRHSKLLWSSADAIAQHYRPTGPTDVLPDFGTPAVVALADKLDTLAYFFAHNLLPTSSSDPYALRRSALGVLRILLTYDAPHPFTIILRFVLQGMPPEQFSALQAFMLARLRVYLKTLGHGSLFIQFALSNENILEEMPLCALRDWITGVEGFFTSSSGTLVLSLFKRIRSIVPADFTPVPLDYTLLPTSFDTDLYGAYTAIFDDFGRRRGDRGFVIIREDNERMLKNLNLFLRLNGPLEAFFDNVLVHDADKAIAEQRLSLLRAIYDLSAPYGDVHVLF